MKMPLIAARLFLAAAPLLAQAPSPGSSVHSSGLGFVYSAPPGWEVVENPSNASLRRKLQKVAAADAEKRATSCTQTVLTAKHGTPVSQIVVVELPFDCFGEPLSSHDLPGFGRGASQGIAEAFDVSAPSDGPYTLGAHGFWIERATGSPKGHPETRYTVETVCTALKKAAVCWIATMADEDSLKAFEESAVRLEGDSQPVLVPVTAFDHKPS
jgi:hypothetical protein